MTVAKIIIQGPRSSYKSVLAELIANTLSNECIAYQSNETEEDKLYEEKLNKLSERCEVVEIEVKNLCREPKSNLEQSFLHGQVAAGGYDNLNRDYPAGNINVCKGVSFELPEVVEAIIRSNRGVHRTLSKLATYYRQRSEAETDERYVATYLEAAKHLELAAEFSTFLT